MRRVRVRLAAVFHFSGPTPWDSVTVVTPRTELTAVDETIARLNIDYYRKRLGAETDEAKRAMLNRLLAEEVAKLVGVSAAGQEERGG
jgi:hypothetical protein